MTDSIAMPSEPIPPMSGGFSIADVLKRSLALLGKYPLQIAVLVGVAFAPTIIISLAMSNGLHMIPPLPDYPDNAALVAHSTAVNAILWKFAPYLLLSWLWSLLAFPTIIFGLCDIFKGKSPAPNTWVRYGLQRILPMIGMTLLLVLLTLAASLMFAIPLMISVMASPRFGTFMSLLGILFLTVLILYILTLTYFSRLCVTIGELGPWQSLLRSGMLGKGKRWRVAGLLFLSYIPIIAIGASIEKIISMISGQGSPILMCVTLFVYLAITMFVLTMQIVAYQRIDKTRY